MITASRPSRDGQNPAYRPAPHLFYQSSSDFTLPTKLCGKEMVLDLRGVGLSTEVLLLVSFLFGLLYSTDAFALFHFAPGNASRKRDPTGERGAHLVGERLDG